MKKLTRFQKVLVAVLVVCLIIGTAAWFITRTTSREATPEEMEKYAPYDVLWETMPEAGEGQTEKDRLLALCTALEATQVGENQYDGYTSETLGGSLYDCRQVDQILVSADGVLFITYTTDGGLTVILGYDDAGLRERSIYDPALDTLYYELDGTVTVFENFSNRMMS